MVGTMTMRFPSRRAWSLHACISRMSEMLGNPAMGKGSSRASFDFATLRTNGYERLSPSVPSV